MKISALIANSQGSHHVTLRTHETAHHLTIAPKPTGFGSSANGGELLCLALATCFCNDIYREAAKNNIQVERVEVEVESEFGAEGMPAESITYRAKITAHAGEETIRALMQQTDRVAEIQNTLRTGVSVTLDRIDVECA